LIQQKLNPILAKASSDPGERADKGSKKCVVAVDVCSVSLGGSVMAMCAA
jgi:hypothetical protein